TRRSTRSSPTEPRPPCTASIHACSKHSTWSPWHVCVCWAKWQSITNGRSTPSSRFPDWRRSCAETFSCAEQGAATGFTRRHRIRTENTMKAACYFSIGTRPWLRHILSASIASLVVVGAAHGQSTQADAGVMATPSSGQGVSLSYGYHAKYQRFGLAYETAPLWTYSFANNGRLDLSVELGASYWQANHAKPGSMWQLAAVPMLRWWLQPQYYLELGVGP